MEAAEQALTTKIGFRLREVQKARRLSPAALSELTGGKLSKSRISNYEQGIRRMGLEEAKILADALGSASASYLLILDDEGFLPDEEMALLRCFRSTDTRGRQAIIEVAEMQCAHSGG